MPDILNIVGVGNVLMGDDGVGISALEALARRGTPEGVCLHDAGLAVSDVLGRLDPRRPLVVLDAVRAGGPPGSIHRLSVDVSAGAAGAVAVAGGISLHELSVVPALQIEAVSGRDFRDVTVFGVEPEAIAWGEGLSPAVGKAVGPLVDAVLEYLRERALAARAAAPAPPPQTQTADSR